MKKRKDGNYQKEITYKGYKKHVYGKKQEDIAEKVKEFKKYVDMLEISKDMFESWLERWWEYHQKQIKHNTIESYLKPIEDVKDEFSGKLMSEIKPSDIKSFIYDLAEKGYARQTINLRHIVLCKTFDYAIEHDIDIANVARAIRLPKGLPKSKRENLTEAEIQIVKDSKDVFANFLLYTGCRKNEALAVEWSDIDFKAKTIAISKAVVFINNKPTISDPKTESGNRTIPLLDPLEKLLKPQKKKTGYVFNKENNLLEKKQARYMWEKYEKKIGVHITPHQFRHAFITIMYYAGIDVKTAQAIAGHAKVDTILNIYTHLDKQNQEKSREKLNDYFSKSKKSSKVKTIA